MKIRFALISSAMAAILLTSTAADHSPPDHAQSHSPARSASGTTPRSAPVAYPSVTSSAESQPTAQQCDPSGSLRPQDPLPEPGRMPAGSAMAGIVERGQLRVAVGPDSYLLSFREPETGQVKGFDIDIAGDIAEAIFGDRDRVEYRQLDVPGRLRAVQLDPTEPSAVDLVAGAMTITCQRQQQVEFSSVYYQAGQRVLVNRRSGVTGLDDLTDQRVCAARGSTSLQRILAIASGPVPVGVPGATDCLVMLQLGEVAAISTDDTLLAGMVAQDPGIEIVGPQIGPEPYGIVFNQKAPDLVRFVNAVLERRVADGRWRQSYQDWLQEALGPPPEPPRPRYRD